MRMRMSALMKQRVIFVFTHDSIGLGEDGPTHQAVEQTATLRYIPNMEVWRPCDTVESAAAWIAAVERHDGPTSLVFTRQNLAFQKRDAAQIANIRKGAYVLSEAAGGKPKAVIIATGSEVDLAIKAQAALAAEGISVRVVSMPSTNVFDKQDQNYKDSVLAQGHQARGGRSRRDRRLVQVCRSGRRDRRHGLLWRIGAGTGTVQAFRLHSRECGEGR